MVRSPGSLKNEKCVPGDEVVSSLLDPAYGHLSFHQNSLFIDKNLSISKLISTQKPFANVEQLSKVLYVIFA